MFERKKTDSTQPTLNEPTVPTENTANTNHAPNTPVHSSQKPLIGKNVLINGDVTFHGDLILEGVVKGDVISADENAHLVIQNGASINGDVKVAHIQHNGSILGSVESSGLLTVSTTGTVVGPVKYNQLILEMGAVVNGTLEQIHVDVAVAESKTEESPTFSED